MTLREFCDSAWGVWLGLFLLAIVIAPEIGGILLLCFAAWSLYHLCRWIVEGVLVSVRTGCDGWRALVQRWQRQNWERDSQRRQAEAERHWRQREADQHRREEARLSCRLAYLARGDMEQLQRAEFDALLESFLSDNDPPELVEKRAARLMEFLEAQHKGQASDLPGIIAEHERQKQQVAGLPLENPVKQSLLSLLERRFYIRLEELLERN